ncbi:single-stranded DNA-binding protein [Candidatus Berkelbacteria bacterium CG10_big_fil_rev_8_21_14_0_10_41_12]|uniref:Single-stranded DNA-binding protein n=1 Tax=Candidatus Berkelbacteria bacterium CG10_big_fil_rev_8_21_14_0_10_41_12 TaxID=1974513 RepID=A0A2M6WWE1_9BACT|nr:MAG: single-stranded DNA-binding protein [Candidatus Berkelbacteria bacterium CG10_big_fil_rev_8_21_14_0_10_41_12]
MLNLNRAMVIGNITRDLEVRYTPNGQAVTNFGVATNRRWNDSDGNQKEAVEYHEIVAWGKLAEIAGQYAKKGQKVYVEGRLQTRSWEGQDGAKRNKTEIIAENFILLSPKSGDIAASRDSVEVDVNKDKKEIKAKPKKSADTADEKSSDKGNKDKQEDNDEEINLDDIPF